jgi:lipopolysaccharide transport system permease protein
MRAAPEEIPASRWSNTTVNDANITPPLIDARQLVEYRHFLALLVRREIQLRYRHTLVGVSWTVLNPLITMAVFGLIIPNLIAPSTLTTHTQGVPYPVYVYCGLVPWTCFAVALTRVNTSLLDQAPLLKNMYFPRLLLPIAKVLAVLSELLIACLALALLMALLRVAPSRHIIALPLFLLLLAIACLGGGLLLATAQVRYRDVLFLAQYSLQLGLMVTPVWFSLNVLPASLRWAVAVNPMAAVVQGFRWSVLGVDAPSVSVVLTSPITAIALLLLGLFYFSRRQETVADFV